MTPLVGLALLVALLAWDRPAGAACSQPTRAILVRHAETEWNARGLLQGQANIPLSAIGRAEAETLAQAVADKPVDAVYASPLARALETARAIASRRGLPVTTRNDLHEIGVGVFTGHPSRAIPEALRTAWSTNPDFAMPSGVPDASGLPEPGPVQGKWFEGESLNMVSERAWREIRALVERHCGQSILVVTHGGVIQVVLARARGLPVTESRKLRVANVSQTVLEFAPDGSVVLTPGW